MNPRAEGLAVVLDAVVLGEPEEAIDAALERYGQTGDAWHLALASFAAVVAQQHERASMLAQSALTGTAANPGTRSCATSRAPPSDSPTRAGSASTGVDPLEAAAEDPADARPATPASSPATCSSRPPSRAPASTSPSRSPSEPARCRRRFLENAGRPHPYLSVMAMTDVRLFVFRGRIDDAARRHAQVTTDSGAPLVDLVVAATGSLVGGNAADRGTARSLADRVEQAHPEPRDLLERGMLVAWPPTDWSRSATSPRAARTILLAGRGPDLASLAIIDRALGFEMLVAAAALEGDLDIAEAWRARAEPLADSPIANSTVARLISRVELLAGRCRPRHRMGRPGGSARARRGPRRRSDGGRDRREPRPHRGDGGGTAHARLEAMVEQAEAAGHHAVRKSASRELRAAGRRLRPRAGSEWAGLSAREQAVAELLSAGRTNRQIAGELHVSEHTVRIHVSRVLAAFGAGSRFAVATRLAELFPSDAPATTVELTPRQRAVADRIALGWANPRIATDLGVSVRTVEKHLGDIRRRWGVAARAEIARLALGARATDAAAAPS